MHKEDVISSLSSRNSRDNYFAVVIPALNESLNIEAVVRQIDQEILVIVIDDGSTDDTAIRARCAGANVVSHTSNMGYDAALATGIRTAIELGCVFAVTIDADGQHDPSLLKKFFVELEAGADVVLGIRDYKQRWSEVLFGFMSRFIWSVCDPLCGMKGYRLEILGNIKNLNTYSSIGTELAIRAVKAKVKVCQLPIVTRQRNGVSRFGGGIKANIRIIKALYYGVFFAAPLSKKKLTVNAK